MMDETTNRTDNGEAELEREIEERYAAMRGTPMRVPAHLREFMRATYAARALEKAAASRFTGEGMRKAPETPGVGIPADPNSITTSERRSAQAIEAMRMADLAESKETA